MTKSQVRHSTVINTDVNTQGHLADTKIMVYVLVRIRIRIRMSFIARYVCTHKEFVLMTVAPQCDRMTATGQDTDNNNNN